MLCVQEEDRVVAQHPSHSSSFAPGIVLAVDEVLQTATIKFYDGQEGTVSRVEVYRLPQEKYNHDVLHIQQRQQSMLGLSVVARDDNTGEYFPGECFSLSVFDIGSSWVIQLQAAIGTEDDGHLFAFVDVDGFVTRLCFSCEGFGLVQHLSFSLMQTLYHLYQQECITCCSTMSFVFFRF